MKKYIYISFCFLLMFYNFLDCKEVEKINYPILDFTAGIGIMWLFQTNLTISPTHYIYLQPRLSFVPLVAYEFGGVIGLQTRFQNNAIIRLGIGYSKGESHSINPEAESKDEDEFWKTTYIRVDLLSRLNRYLVISPNINISRFDKKPIFSGNLTIGFCLFRKGK